MRCKDAANYGNAAQRFGGEADALASGPGYYLVNILVEQVEIEVGEGHGMIGEELFVVGVVVTRMGWDRMGGRVRMGRRVKMGRWDRMGWRDRMGASPIPTIYGGGGGVWGVGHFG